jgi:hypothetical protein
MGSQYEFATRNCQIFFIDLFNRIDAHASPGWSRNRITIGFFLITLLALLLIYYLLFAEKWWSGAWAVLHFYVWQVIGYERRRPRSRPKGHNVVCFALITCFWMWFMIKMVFRYFTSTARFFVYCFHYFIYFYSLLLLIYLLFLASLMWLKFRP